MLSLAAMARDPVQWEKLWDLFTEIYEPKVARQETTAKAVDLTLDTGALGGRTYLEIWISSSGPATFTVLASMDGYNWREIDTITLDAAGDTHKGYFNAARYIRVTGGEGLNNTVEIWASR